MNRSLLHPSETSIRSGSSKSMEELSHRNSRLHWKKTCIYIFWSKMFNISLQEHSIFFHIRLEPPAWHSHETLGEDSHPMPVGAAVTPQPFCRMAVISEDGIPSSSHLWWRNVCGGKIGNKEESLVMWITEILFPRSCSLLAQVSSSLHGTILSGTVSLPLPCCSPPV